MITVFDAQVLRMDAKVQRILDLCLEGHQGPKNLNCKRSTEEEEEEEEEADEEEYEEEEDYHPEYSYQEEYQIYQEEQDDSSPSVSVIEKVLPTADGPLAPCRPTPPSLRLRIDREGVPLSPAAETASSGSPSTSSRKKHVTLR